MFSRKGLIQFKKEMGSVWHRHLVALFTSNILDGIKTTEQYWEVREHAREDSSHVVEWKGHWWEQQEVMVYSKPQTPSMNFVGTWHAEFCLLNCAKMHTRTCGLMHFSKSKTADYNYSSHREWILVLLEPNVAAGWSLKCRLKPFYASMLYCWVSRWFPNQNNLRSLHLRILEVCILAFHLLQVSLPSFWQFVVNFILHFINFRKLKFYIVIFYL